MAAPKSCRLLAGLLASGPAVFALSAPPGHTPLPMWEEPSHQPVFHSGHVRVMDVFFPGGATSEFHFHENAATYIFVQPGRIADQTYGEDWVKFPQDALTRGLVLMRTDYLARNLFHRVRNIDTQPTQIFAVVNLAQQEADPAGAMTEMTGKEIDNAWFRVRQLQVGPRAIGEPVSVADDAILMQAHDGPSHVVANGQSSDYKTLGGNFSFHPAGTRLSVANDDDGTATFFLIEVKD